jgi:hypothetical protein
MHDYTFRNYRLVKLCVGLITRPEESHQVCFVCHRKAQLGAAVPLGKKGVLKLKETDSFETSAMRLPNDVVSHLQENGRLSHVAVITSKLTRNYKLGLFSS